MELGSENGCYWSFPRLGHVSSRGRASGQRTARCGWLGFAGALVG